MENKSLVNITWQYDKNIQLSWTRTKCLENLGECCRKKQGKVKAKDETRKSRKGRICILNKMWQKPMLSFIISSKHAIMGFSIPSSAHDSEKNEKKFYHSIKVFHFFTRPNGKYHQERNLKNQFSILTGVSNHRIYFFLYDSLALSGE